MLCKLSISNIRKSLKDYAVYFFTLIIGVAIFYAFNAIGTQAAYLKLEYDTREVVELLKMMLSGMSVFVAVVLGLLVVYASRFLMKRRKKEFALYLMLGMDKGRVSAILLLETLFIGLGSLGVGMFAGIGVSQLMSVIVANLFDADMTDYTFTVSGEAVIKTILYFGLMYLVVILFNSVVIGKCRLIDLMQSDRKSETMKLKNPVLCILVFLLSACVLGYAYYRVGWDMHSLSSNGILLMILLGAVATFFIFWSVSGLLLRMVLSMKHLYYRNLNSFTFRQVSSRIHTMVFSMTVICLMLFVTICTLASAFSLRNSMNANLRELCPVDMELAAMVSEPVEEFDFVSFMEETGSGVTKYLSDYVHFQTYGDDAFTFADFCGKYYKVLIEKYPFLKNNKEEIIRLSDYNALMKLYGKKTETLQEDEYILFCDFLSMKDVRNRVLQREKTITIFGKSLHTKYDTCTEGAVRIAAQRINPGVFIVPDEVVDRNFPYYDYLMGNYKEKSKEGKFKTEKKIEKKIDRVYRKMKKDYTELTVGKKDAFWMELNTRLSIASAATGLGAIITFLGLYLGLVFLISCAAILALKVLSESVDSIQGYMILRKIGAEEKDIKESLFCQTGIFFLLPLLLACIHSIFGMKFSIYMLDVFGLAGLTESVISTSVIILLIYGGYFVITYLCSRSIIKDEG